MNRLLSRIETLDEIRKDILSRLQTMAPQDCSAESPLAVVDHLVLTQQVILNNLPDPKHCLAMQPTVRQHIGRIAFFLALRLRLPVRIGCEATPPTQTPMLEDIATRWGDHMAWLRQFVNGMQDDAPFFLHPIAGPLTLAQALNAAILHARLHLPTLSACIRKDTHQRHRRSP